MFEKPDPWTVMGIPPLQKGAVGYTNHMTITSYCMSHGNHVTYDYIICRSHDSTVTS